MSVDSETLVRLRKWAETAGLPVEDLQKKFVKYVEDLRKFHPGRAESFYTARARFLVYKEIKSRRFVRAKPVDGIFFGYWPAWDITAAQRALATEMFRTNPDKAIREGWTDAEGTPLDMRSTLPNGRKNPNYGKPLRPVQLARSVALTRPAIGGPMKLTVVTHIGEQALKMPPLGKPVRMLLNLRADEPNRYLYNTSVATSYEPIEMKEIPEVNESTICSILLKAPEEFRPNLSELHDWHRRHENDIRRVCIVEVDVVHVRRAPISTGNYIMVVEDESMMDLEAEGVTVFVPGVHKEMLNFAAGSRVVVVGSSAVGPGFDRETRQLDTSIVRPLINACGIWCIPEFRIPLEEEAVIGTDVEVTWQGGTTSDVEQTS